VNAARAFVAGRGAVSIREVGAWFGRGHSWVYLAIARGQLRKAGPGRVTADSIVELYDSFEGGSK
jgi:hypothetical protein